MSINGCQPNGNQLYDFHPTAMEATGFKVFNDSVHGHITLHPLLVRVVDTPQFQRLRNIKQLGIANYVFPGASHCRYEHSLGTCYLARQMVEKLLEREKNPRSAEVGREENPRSAEERQKFELCVQLAALCHDLGHGPFSHTWELVTQRWGDDWKHEESSVKLFDSLVEANQLDKVFSNYGIEIYEREIIKELIMGGPLEGNKALLKPKDNFLYEIVSNKETGIDVDKWDYFLRDGLHLNLNITFDYRRLLEFCTVVTGSDGRTHIAFRDKEIMNLYDMYRVRSALHQMAYKHRVVFNIELMFVDGFAAAGEADYRINNSEVLLKEAHKNPESMSEMTDHLFYDILYSNDPNLKIAKKLFKRVLQRKLYVFVEKANIQISQDHPVKGRQHYIAQKKAELMQKLTSICPNYEFGIREFYLDLDCYNDPVSKVMFYTKQRGSNQIEKQSYEKIKDLLDPFPFQLTSQPTAVLTVFCKTEGVKEQHLTVVKTVIKEFSQNV